MRKVLLVASFLWFPGVIPTAGNQPRDPLDQTVSQLDLKKEGLLVGIAKLNITTSGVGYAVELVPGTLRSAPPPDPLLTARLDRTTLRAALNWLCALDPRYGWSRDGNMVNVYPTSSQSDRTYFFTRKIARLRLENESSPLKAVGAIVKPLANPNERLVSWQPTPDFSKPWSVVFEDLTVRQALNRIARQIGAEYGWLATGNSEVRIFSFHERLEPVAAREK